MCPLAVTSRVPPYLRLIAFTRMTSLVVRIHHHPTPLPSPIIIKASGPNAFKLLMIALADPCTKMAAQLQSYQEVAPLLKHKDPVSSARDWGAGSELSIKIHTRD